MATQTVTVLFTDLVGSTELSSRLGPEATESLRQTHFGLLRGAIQAAGGVEVKNLGDGLMVAFTSLSRALACAADLRRTDAAPLLYDQLLPYAARFVFVFSLDWGAAARALGRLATLLGRYDDAERHLHDALAMHERIDAPYWIARNRIDLAELCLARCAGDDLSAAHDHLDQAQRTVDEYGYAGLQPRIDRLRRQL